VAGVSRNSLYRYHAPILKALRDHQRHCPGFAHAKARKSAVQRRAENIGLRADIAKLAALVDHYYAAYRETASLLERRDRELAELRSKLKLAPRVAAIRRSITTLKSGVRLLNMKGPGAPVAPGPT
jgi:hypothetical protein